MTREEVHNLMENELRCVQRANYCDRDCAKCFLVKEDKELIEAYTYVIKALEQEPCEDAVSRQAVMDMTGLSEWFDSSDSYNEFVIALSKLPPVTPTHTETVTEFADRCRECGARYGRYKDFCKFVAEMVLRDDFEENAGANAEILCRKLSKLGIVKADEDEWVLVESEVEE